MARIAGVDLPREKRVEIGLTYIYGIGRVVSNRLLNEAGVSPDTRVKDLTDDEVARIQKAIETLEVPVEGDLRREIALNIKRLQEIGCYRGIRDRHISRLHSTIQSLHLQIQRVTLYHGLVPVV